MLNHHAFRSFLLASAVIALAFAGPRNAVAGLTTYIALGDSLAFGTNVNDTSTDISNGDRGYVAAFANALGGRQGGVRPNLFDLAIPGETSTSFFQGGGGIGGVGAPLQNTHYTNPPVTQNSLLLSTIASEKAAGNTISTVTIQLGANDLYQTANTPGFFSLPSSQQQALILQTLGNIQANDTMLLTELRTMLPSAQLIMMGYYDPYAPFLNDPTSPFFAIAQASHVAIPALNQVIAGEAAAFGGLYVDEYTPFVGNELAYTYVGSSADGNTHPNAAGYAAISSQLISTALPEPSSFGLALLGGAIVVLVRRRGRAASGVRIP